MLHLFKKKRIYLDYAAATPMSAYVKGKLKEVENNFANPSGIYTSGVDVKNKIEKTRKDVLSYFRAEGMSLIFTSTATESINIFLLGTLAKGDHFITSKIEHPAVLECAYHLEKNGIEVTYLNVDEFGFIDKQQLRESLRDNTKVVSVMMVNNEIGTAQNIKEIGRIVDEYKRKNNSEFPKFHSDVCQAINYFEIDMRAMRLDAISFNSSKNYGGKGAGALIYRKDVEIVSTNFGGGQEKNLRSGTENVQAIVALGASIYESNKILREAEYIRLQELQKYFFTVIKKEIPEAIICGADTSDDRLAKEFEKKDRYVLRSPNNINLIFPGLISEEMILRLDYFGFEISHKSACASRESEAGSYVLEAIGRSQKDATENVRITLGRETKKKDLDNLISRIKEIYYQYKK